MLIAQITDLHLGAMRGDPAQSNEARLAAVLARLRAMHPAPDLLLVTGDLTERGEDGAYADLAAQLGALPWPVLPAIGNHDRRDAFRAHFPHVPGRDGFVHYVHEAGPLRIVVLDSVEEERHGGAFCAARARWLEARLDEAPDRPTILVIHHPPVETGIGWMTIRPREPWVGRLARVLVGRQNIVALLAGHIHRTMVARFASTELVTCPSVAPAVALELAPLDPLRPDNRAMVVADPPAYALHLWTGARLVSHFDTAAPHVPIARFDAVMQPTVEKLVNEPQA
jgi:3',5'-cyclic AMP phosphodiesterase CpdA